MISLNFSYSSIQEEPDGIYSEMSYSTNKSTTTPFWERWVGYDRQRSLNSSYDNQRINKEDQKDYEKYVQIDDELLPLQQENSQMSSYGACLRTRNRTNNFVKHKVLPNETLVGIAIKYGANLEDLKRENRLISDFDLGLKKSLIVPIIENSNIGKHNELSNENKDFDDLLYQKVKALSNVDDKAKKPKTNSMEHKEDFFSSFDANIKLVKSNTRKVIKDMKLEKNTNT